MKWFGIKTIFLTNVHGNPKNADRFYDPDSALLEERIVILKAKNLDEAMAKAEEEAVEYLNSGVHTNPYGQKVVTKYLKILDAFELYDSPRNCCEVFSSTRIIDKNESRASIEKMILGKHEGKAQLKKRRKFLNKDFN